MNYRIIFQDNEVLIMDVFSWRGYVRVSFGLGVDVPVDATRSLFKN